MTTIATLGRNKSRQYKSREFEGRRCQPHSVISVTAINPWPNEMESEIRNNQCLVQRISMTSLQWYPCFVHVLFSSILSKEPVPVRVSVWPCPFALRNSLIYSYSMFQCTGTTWAASAARLRHRSSRTCTTSRPAARRLANVDHATSGILYSDFRVSEKAGNLKFCRSSHGEWRWPTECRSSSGSPSSRSSPATGTMTRHATQRSR